MMITDSALARRHDDGNPIRVGVVGAGAMARGFVAHVGASVPGMTVAAIANRTPSRATEIYAAAQLGQAIEAEDLDALELSLESGRPVVTSDARLLCEAEGIDALIDMTGAIEFGAHLAVTAISHRKPLVLMNAEVDATVGPVLHQLSRSNGGFLTMVDGDQPGVQMNLWRQVRSLGLTPRVLGNVKGLQDVRRTPTTQASFAKKWRQDPYMVTSFADGSKVNIEQCLVANATGFVAPQRGLNQWDHRGHVDELVHRYDPESLNAAGGIVDYVVGALPAPGVYCIAEQRDEVQQHYLRLYKLGDGPLYCFYSPYHLCHLEAPMSIARAVIHGDAVGQAQGPPVVEVVAIAKRDLSPGDSLDRLGGYTTYGQCENAGVALSDRLLPQGLAEGCTITRSVGQDEPITWDDVEVPAGRLVDELHRIQRRWSHDPATEPGSLPPLPASSPIARGAGARSDPLPTQSRSRAGNSGESSR